MLQKDEYGGHVKDVCIHGKLFTLGWCLPYFNYKLLCDAL